MGSENLLLRAELHDLGCRLACVGQAAGVRLRLLRSGPLLLLRGYVLPIYAFGQYRPSAPFTHTHKLHAGTVLYVRFSVREHFKFPAENSRRPNEFLVGDYNPEFSRVASGAAVKGGSSGDMQLKVLK